MWDRVLSVLGGNIFGGVADIIGKLKVDPTEAAKLTAELQKAELAMQQAVNVAAAEIIKAEASSGDKFTSRARPAFIWMITIVLGLNFGVAAMAAWVHYTITPITIPDTLYTLFEIGFTGYVVGRTVEKVKGVAT